MAHDLTLLDARPQSPTGADSSVASQLTDGETKTVEIPSLQRLGHRALSLGVANAFDFAIQFLLPVVLTRCLDPAAFGEYRLLWLTAGTIVAVATLCMPGSLYYYLPRSNIDQKRMYVNQTMFFLLFAGLLSGWAASAWNPWLPEQLRELTRHGAIMPAFIVLLIIASLLDVLPTVEERVYWQAKAIVSLAVLRAVALSLAAALTGELAPVLAVLVAFVAFKVIVLLFYIFRYHGLQGPVLRWRELVDQLLYAAPFGAAGALYGLRTQSDQWVAASLFPLGMFAAFSIASVLGPLMNLFRQSVNYAFLPIMSRRHALGDIPGMLELNSRGNVMVGAIVFPLFYFAFVFAEDLITLVYTANYVAAVPVVRVYIVGIAALVIELSGLTLLLRQAGFVMVVNTMGLVLAVAVNWYAATRIGLAGAAMGTVIVMAIDRIVTLWRISRLTGVPISKLQDWKTLLLLALFAAGASLLAWAVKVLHFAHSGPVIRMMAGAAVLVSSYVALAALSGAGRTWLAAVRTQKHGT